MKTTALTRRSFLPAAALLGTAARGRRPEPPCTAADRARLRAAAGAVEASIEELYALKPLKGAPVEYYLGVWQPTLRRHRAAESALIGLMQAGRIGALVVAGELYFDVDQDDSSHVEAQGLLTLDASLILDLD